jgi:glycine/D-amino acid oxidase-like deaminating enzyme
MSPRVIIVGGGIMGLSAAWAAHRRGMAVTLLEQAGIPNPLGSSFDRHRLIRYAYGDRIGYCRMVGEAYAAWARLWADLGEQLYVKTGTLLLSGAEQGWAAASMRTLEAAGIPYRRLEPGLVERRWAHLKPDGIAFAVHLDSGGVLLADRILAALADWLRPRIELREHCYVREIDAAHGAVRLQDGGTLTSDRLVVAAGPWTGRLVPVLGDRIVPSRQVLAYVAPPPRFAAGWATAPMVLENTDDVGFYAVPPVAGTPLKIGDHHFTRRGDPDHERTPAAAEIAAVLALARGRLADADTYSAGGGRSCFYTVTEDERFIAEPVGEAMVLSPCSGHGFKFGAVIGERVAAWLDGECSADDLRSWIAGH